MRRTNMRTPHTRSLLQNIITIPSHTHTTMMMNRQRRSNMVLANTNYSVQLINMHEYMTSSLLHTYIVVFEVAAHSCTQWGGGLS